MRLPDNNHVYSMLRFHTDCGERSVGICGIWSEIPLWELNGKNVKRMVCFVL